jgi:CubicO group peptidase (beta-lactamase class C family)
LAELIHRAILIGSRRIIDMRTALPAVRVICFAVLAISISTCATAEEITDALQAFLQHRVDVEKREVGIVVGLVDANGSRVVSYGNLVNGADQKIDGDTLFDIASITKPFTGLLLQDMIERGEMRLDDPVAKYLPASVKMPTYGGKHITLRHLAAHTSGLPHFAENLVSKRVDNPFADYGAQELYAFLSAYKLVYDPGTTFEYSSLGMSLLGHAIALKAGSDYESLVVQRICRPLKMDSTRITLTPELKSRFATGHNQFGEPVPSWDRQTLLGGSALRSTANDLLKFLSANLGLTPTHLTPLMEKTHVTQLVRAIPETDIGLAWMITRLHGTRIVHHGGEAPGYCSVIALDKKRRRGVVVLVSSHNGADADAIAMLLLACEWQSGNRPSASIVSSSVYDKCVGQYRLKPDLSVGMVTMRLLFRNAPKAVFLVPLVVCLAILFFLLRRFRSSRQGWLILGGGTLVGVPLAALAVKLLAHVICALFHLDMDIRRENDRLFLRYNIRLSPVAVDFLPPNSTMFLPRITGEIVPETETRFFERLTGMPITFARDDQGNVNQLTIDFLGNTFSCEKISPQPSRANEPLKPRVAIKLDTTILDAYVGRYEFPPHPSFPTGIKATIRREGDQLIWQAQGKNILPGLFNIYPQSETEFFLKVTGGQLSFSTDHDKEEVRSVIIRDDICLPNVEGKKVK